MPCGFFFRHGFLIKDGFRFSVKGKEMEGRVEKSRSYRDLEVWKLAVDFVKQIYQATQKFPASEIYDNPWHIIVCHPERSEGSRFFARFAPSE